MDLVHALIAGSAAEVVARCAASAQQLQAAQRSGSASQAGTPAQAMFVTMVRAAVTACGRDLPQQAQMAVLRWLGVLLLERGAWCTGPEAEAVVALLARVASLATPDECTRLAINALGNVCIKAKMNVVKPFFPRIWSCLVSVLERSLAPDPAQRPALTETSKRCSSTLRALHLLLDDTIDGLLTSAHVDHLVPNIVAAQRMALVRLASPLSADLVSSDSDVSDVESESTASQSITANKLLINAIVCAETLIRRGNKLMHSHFLALTVGPNGMSFVFSAPHLSIRARILAAKCLISLIDVCQPVLALAEQPRRPSASFISLSERLAGALHDLHSSSLRAMSAEMVTFENSALVDALLRLITALIRATPYHKLPVTPTVAPLLSMLGDLITRLGHDPIEAHQHQDVLASGLEAVAAACLSATPAQLHSADVLQSLQTIVANLISTDSPDREVSSSSSLVVVAAWTVARALAVIGLTERPLRQQLLERVLVVATLNRGREEEQVAAIQSLLSLFGGIEDGFPDSDMIGRVLSVLLPRLQSALVVLMTNRTDVALTAVVALLDAISRISTKVFCGHHLGSVAELVHDVTVQVLATPSVPLTAPVRSAAWAIVGGSLARTLVDREHWIADGAPLVVQWHRSLEDMTEQLSVKVRAAAALANVCDLLHETTTRSDTLLMLVDHVCTDSDKVRLFGLRAAGALLACERGDRILLSRFAATLSPDKTGSGTTISAKTRWNAAASACRALVASPAYFKLLAAERELADLARAARQYLSTTQRCAAPNYKVSMCAVGVLICLVHRHPVHVADPAQLAQETLGCLSHHTQGGAEAIMAFQEQQHRSQLIFRLRVLVYRLAPLLAPQDQAGVATILVDLMSSVPATARTDNDGDCGATTDVLQSALALNRQHIAQLVAAFGHH